MAMSDLNRYRDRNGALGRAHGDTMVSVLRKVYGTSFALDFDEEAKLADILGTLDDVSLGQLVKDHEAGGIRRGVEPPR